MWWVASSYETITFLWFISCIYDYMIHNIIYTWIKDKNSPKKNKQHFIIMIMPLPCRCKGRGFLLNLIWSFSSLLALQLMHARNLLLTQKSASTEKILLLVNYRCALCKFFTFFIIRLYILRKVAVEGILALVSLPAYWKDKLREKTAIIFHTAGEGDGSTLQFL